MLSADMPRAETTPLYRGLTLDTQDFLRGTPGHSIDYDSGPRSIVLRDPSLEDALFEDTQEPYLRREPVGSPSRPGPNRELTTDPDLAGHILDYLESGSGIGTHWSADREIGDAFGRPGSDTNNHFPVRLKSEWGGQDEDHDRNHTAGEWDEDEITRLPGSQVNLTGLETLIPGEDEWRSYDFPGGEIRRAQRVAMPAPTPESITYNYQDYFDSDPMVDDFWGEWPEGEPEGGWPVIPTPAVVARDNGIPVGYLAWEHGHMPDNPPEIASIEVHPEYRRKGIGTGLYDFARQQPTGEGLHHSDSQTPKGQLWAEYEENRPAQHTASFDPYDEAEGIMSEYQT